MKSTPLEPENLNGRKEERFETDSQRIVRRHLENKNDIITDEDLRSVRIGVDPDESSQITDEEIEEAGELLQGPEEKHNTIKKRTAPVDEPTTPWDTIE